METAPLPMVENSEEAGTRVRHRLGIVGRPGFSPVPHLLLLYQHELGLSSAELNVFLNIFMHWHDASKHPFVHVSTIAKRIGTSPRRVQRIVSSLKKKGMLLQVPGATRKARKEFDVRPLLLKLQPHAKQWVAVQEERLNAVRPSIEEMPAPLPDVV